jgi:hypothetical protein
LKEILDSPMDYSREVLDNIRNLPNPLIFIKNNIFDKIILNLSEFSTEAITELKALARIDKKGSFIIVFVQKNILDKIWPLIDSIRNSLNQ